MNQDEVKLFFTDLMHKVRQEIIQDEIKNADSSNVNNQWIKEAICLISRLESGCDQLLAMCESIGGFCNSYPKRCWTNLETMRLILQEEIHD